MSSLCGRVSRKAVVGFCAHEAGEAPAAVPWQARWETMRREQKRAGRGGSEVGVWLVFRMFSWGTAGPLNSLHSPLFRQWLFLPCCLSHHKWTQEPQATSARMESALPTLPENNLRLPRALSGLREVLFRRHLLQDWLRRPFGSPQSLLCSPLA